MTHGLCDASLLHRCESGTRLRSVSDGSFMAGVQSAVGFLGGNSWNRAQALSAVTTSHLVEVSVAWSLPTRSLKTTPSHL